MVEKPIYEFCKFGNNGSQNLVKKFITHTPCMSDKSMSMLLTFNPSATEDI